MRTDALKCIFRRIKQKADSEQAQQTARYLKKTQAEVLGVRLPEIHSAVEDCIKNMETRDLVPLMQELWEARKHEIRLAAIDVMKQYSKSGDVGTAMGIASEWIRDIDTWAQMDPLASNCIGTLLLRDPEIEKALRKWAIADNYWRRRASILPYLHLSKKTVYRREFADRILNAIQPHLDDTEFFVGKAAAWVLREFSKREPERAKEFIKRNKDRMTPLVFREGSKKLKDV